MLQVTHFASGQVKRFIETIAVFVSHDDDDDHDDHDDGEKSIPYFINSIG